MPPLNDPPRAMEAKTMPTDGGFVAAGTLIAFGILVATILPLELAPQPDEQTAAYAIQHSGRVLMMLLGIFAFGALYRLLARPGRASLATGYILLTTGFALLLALEFLFAYFVPFVARESPAFIAALEAGTLEPPIAMILAFVGADLIMLAGAATFFGGALHHRQLARLPVVAALTSLAVLSLSDYIHLFVHVAAGVAFGVSCIWVGALLWQDASRTASESAREHAQKPFASLGAVRGK